MPLVTGEPYYRARYYDPQVGRFISDDPIPFGGANNFYAYVRNDPGNYIDPLGLMGCVKTALGLVCWNDGKRPITILYPQGPPSSPAFNAAEIAAAFSAFDNCSQGALHCKSALPKIPASGNPFQPPAGPKADMGVTPNEGTLPMPDYGDIREKNCECLKQHPLAALDNRFHSTFGNRNYGISPGCQVSIF